MSHYDPKEWDYGFGMLVTRDMIGSFLGKRIGSGISRQVFEWGPNDEYVVKVETAAQSFQNVIEYEVWQEVRETKWAKWFAPVTWISEGGMVVLQRRTQPIKSRAQLPERVPNFFTDLKMQNFGMLKGHLVAHDYGLNRLMTYGLSRVRMNKAPWWAEGEKT